MTWLRRFVQKTLRRFGYRLVSITGATSDSVFEKLHARVKEYTMTSHERQLALFDAVNYIERNRIPGSFVECGVWRGGSSMLAALTLREHRNTERDLYLYDTFAGMTEPTAHDVNLHGRAAASRWRELDRGDVNEWDYAPLEEVEKNLASTGYPSERLHFIRGKVEDTIPGTVPERIALLRLDTDWYESTKHELEHLFPRLVPGGVLILDDYGHWKGARKAVDEYVAQLATPLFLVRIDYSGRIAIKPPAA